MSFAAQEQLAESNVAHDVQYGGGAKIMQLDRRTPGARGGMGGLKTHRLLADLGLGIPAPPEMG